MRFLSCFQPQVFGVIEAEAHDMDGSVFALSLEQLKEHNPQPAGYAMHECMTALPKNGTVVSNYLVGDGFHETEPAADLFVRNPALLHPALAWHADGHEWRVEGSHPWSLDDEDMQQQLDWQEVAGGGKVFNAPLPPDTRLHQWIAAQLQPPAGSNGHGITLSRVEVVKSATTIAGFHYRLKQTAARLTANGGNNPFVKAWPGDAVKAAMLRHLESQFAAADWDGVRVLPLWHGCSAAVADEIMSKGPAALATLDAGFFGSGIYFTPQPEYAAAYAAGCFAPQFSAPNADGDHVILLCAVCVGSVYPITRAADYPAHGKASKFKGKPLHSGCDAHHALVDSSTSWQAAKTATPLQHHFEEIVVAQEAQVLPIAKVSVKVDIAQLSQFLKAYPAKSLSQSQSQP